MKREARGVVLRSKKVREREGLPGVRREAKQIHFFWKGVTNKLKRYFLGGDKQEGKKIGVAPTLKRLGRAGRVTRRTSKNNNRRKERRREACDHLRTRRNELAHEWREKRRVRSVGGGPT